jgi:hypothetical protein
MNMTPSKSWTSSVGAWGALILVASQLLNMFLGVTITPDEQKILTDAWGHATQAYTNALTVIGAIMAVVGRRNARQPVHFFEPYVLDQHGNKVLTLKTPEPPPDIAKRMAETPLPK